MKRFAVCLAVLMIAVMVGGSAWAYDDREHVKVAPNGKGDLLIFPYFFAYPGDYSTKITVINTSTTHSVVAKVVYRSWNWSQELKDHFIYLSPNDVWIGFLVNEGGIAKIQSNDDSMLGRYTTYPAKDEDFANITPVNEPLVNAACSDDTNTMGYIEIIEAASRLESKANTGYNPGDRVAKRHIFDWYDQYVSRENLARGIAGVYAPVNVLTGYQENTFGIGATLKQAAVFADYNNREKLTLTAETYLGIFCDNTIAELEAAMAKLNVALPYISKPQGDSSVHIFNFPTKMSTFENGKSCAYSKANSMSPYWKMVNSKCEKYVPSMYDLSENKYGKGSPFSPYTSVNTMCAEAHFNTLMYSEQLALFTEGWIRYSFDKSSAKSGTTMFLSMPISYTGTPVLPSVLYWDVQRGNPAEANAAYDDGVVLVNNVELPYYQYSE